MYPHNSVFFILSAVKSFEIFSRHNGVITIWVSSALGLITPVPLTNK